MIRIKKKKKRTGKSLSDRFRFFLVFRYNLLCLRGRRWWYYCRGAYPRVVPWNALRTDTDGSIILLFFFFREHRVCSCTTSVYRHDNTHCVCIHYAHRYDLRIPPCVVYTYLHQNRYRGLYKRRDIHYNPHADDTRAFWTFFDAYRFSRNYRFFFWFFFHTIIRCLCFCARIRHVCPCVPDDRPFIVIIIDHTYCGMFCHWTRGRLTSMSQRCLIRKKQNKKKE